ncbi:hypothetical protein C1646_746487 [Rhizophagus diaphanus]|nr:hypothetical protein C1646_746487 [Rhizophagus diaphanus] [Rhizophagus sp. MUCL 43196]
MTLLSARIRLSDIPVNKTIKFNLSYPSKRIRPETIPGYIIRGYAKNECPLISAIRSSELFKYVLEFLRNNTLPKRVLTDKALLEELLQEAEFYCIEKLITEIKLNLDSTKNIKIRLWDLEDYLKKGYHVIGKGMELIQYHRCPHRHDPERIGENRYHDSKC